MTLKQIKKVLKDKQCSFVGVQEFKDQNKKIILFNIPETDYTAEIDEKDFTKKKLVLKIEEKTKDIKEAKQNVE